MKVEFHFDFGSPNAYLSHRAIQKIVRRRDIQFEYIPVLLGGVFKATNNVSPMVSMHGIKNKSEYQNIETTRFVEEFQIEGFKRNPYFPVNTLQIMRGAVFAQDKEFYAEYVDLIFQKMWSEEQKMDDSEVISAALEDLPSAASDILSGMTLPNVKQKLIENTEASVARGTFGSPTFFVGDEIYFGKEKLLEIERLV
ncbi:MAG: 2-hydroxychromene-2-carboxylate isomerase [Candidatus Azotimanducaceae bacterium]|jgi:2-hydroxychromene-2-carboxylate isomerase